MFPLCPNGTTKIEGDNVCVYPCPYNNEVFSQDEMYCVSVSCPLDFTEDAMLKDPSDNSICLKTPKPKTNGWCDEGFTEWLTDSCFINCDQSSRDFGQSCILPISRRSFLLPECWPLFYLNDNKDFCLPSLYIILIFVVILYFYFRNKRYQNKVIESKILQPPTLNL